MVPSLSIFKLKKNTISEFFPSGCFDIGSESCLFNKKASITLTGKDGEGYSDPEFGRKFIGEYFIYLFFILLQELVLEELLSSTVRIQVPLGLNYKELY